MLGKSSLSPGEPDLLITLAAGAKRGYPCRDVLARAASRAESGPSLALGVCRILPRSG